MASARDTNSPTGEASSHATAPLLTVEGLQTYFDLRHGIVKAVGPSLCRFFNLACWVSARALNAVGLVAQPPHPC